MSFLVVGCGAAPRLEDLLAAPDDAEFERRLRAIAGSGDPRSVLVLTRALIELPWEEALAPRLHAERRMRKLMAEGALENLVESQEHHRLVAAYVAAVSHGVGSAAQTSAALLRWTKDTLPRLAWDPAAKRFVIRP